MKARRILVASLVLLAGLAGARMAFTQAKPSGASSQSAAVTVPFVGCTSDGQLGPLKAPVGHRKAVAIPAEVAQRIAYYKAEYSSGVLAPRGWHCFSTYGSNGANLFVSPYPIDSKTVLLSGNWKGFSGPAVQISVSCGGTSGRFEVASVIARVFPVYKAFVQNVIAEGLEPASDFPFGPYPNDKLTYRSKSVVEYETPANAQGLGTDSRLQKNASPIEGVAIVSGADKDLVLLSTRLTDRDRDLIPAIVKQVEIDTHASETQ